MMDFNYLLKKTNDFRKLANEPAKPSFDIKPSILFSDTLLSFIISFVQGKFSVKDLNSYMHTNKTMLEQIKRSITWRGKSDRDGLYGQDINGNYILLSKKTNPPKEYVIKSSSILKGVGSIPSLYMYVMIEPDFNPREYPKQLITFIISFSFIIKV